MKPETRKTVMVVATLLVVVALCIIFPRVLAFVELAAREMRYFW